MERRGIAEVGGATAGSTALAGVAVYVLVGGINWPLVVGAGMMAGIAAAANYQARTAHSDAVADEAPSDGTMAGGCTGDDAPTEDRTSGSATADDEWGEETR